MNWVRVVSHSPCRPRGRAVVRWKRDVGHGGFFACRIGRVRRRTFLRAARAFLRRVRHGRRDTSGRAKNPSSGRVRSRHKYLGENVSVRDGTRKKIKQSTPFGFADVKFRGTVGCLLLLVLFNFFYLSFFFYRPRAGECERQPIPPAAATNRRLPRYTAAAARFCSRRRAESFLRTGRASPPALLFRELMNTKNRCRRMNTRKLPYVRRAVTYTSPSAVLLPRVKVRVREIKNSVWKPYALIRSETIFFVFAESTFGNLHSRRLHWFAQRRHVTFVECMSFQKHRRLNRDLTSGLNQDARSDYPMSRFYSDVRIPRAFNMHFRSFCGPAKISFYLTCFYWPGWNRRVVGRKPRTAPAVGIESHICFCQLINDKLISNRF